MTHAIRIDEEVYAWLQKKALEQKAKPFEVTPNSVLREIMTGLKENSGEQINQRTFSKETSGGDEKKTPQRAYREPILKILKQAGGKVPRSEALRNLEATLSNHFTPYDRQKIRTGAVRWERTAEWEVRQMREEQLIQPVHKTPRGIWALTEKGIEAAKHT